MNSTALEAIIEIAIGMVFIWLILSVATMSIQEWIAGFLKWRAKDLEGAIQRLLGDKAWAEQFYNHPLIAGLSKKAGKKPSYIPANKFALTLFDIVMTAGTQESFIQQKLLVANSELRKAPSQLGPFILYIFKRFGTSIGRFFNRVLYIFGRHKGTPDQKYAAILALTQELLLSNDPEKPENLIQSWKEFFRALLSDETNLGGKTLSIPSVEFLEAYPVFRDYFIDLLKVILENQPILKQRWSEILIYNNENLVEGTEENLAEGETLREKLRELSELYAKNFNIKEESLDSIVTCVRQTLDEINFSPLVRYIQNLIGDPTQGLDALQKLNPPLHKTLRQFYGDIIGIAENTKMIEIVRTTSAIAADKLEKTEYNLAAMRLNSETWFNEAMDRLSGTYKRKSTLLAFLIGLVLAIIMNVDSIVLAEHLWKEPAVRQALAANATEFANENTTLPVVKPEGDQGTQELATPRDAIEFFEYQFEGLSIPLGWTFEPVELPLGQKCRLIPIGSNYIWGIKDTKDSTVCQKINNAPFDTAGWFLKVFGIMFSAAAAAQGAPFWFDILKKIVNVRATGVKPNEKAG